MRVSLIRLSIILACLGLASQALAQSTNLNTFSKSDTISSNGDYVEMTTATIGGLGGGFGSVKVQTKDSYSGTWEVQCSVDGSLAGYDTGSELKITPTDGTSVAYSVTDTVAIYDIGNASGCQSIRVIATAGFAASDVTVAITATQSGGSSGGGGGGGAGTSDTTETTQLSVLAAVDGLEALATTSDTSLAAIVTGIDDLTDALTGPGAAIDAVHGEAVIASGPQFIGEAKDIDGGALPNVVTEGQAIRAAFTLSGAAMTTLVNESGSTDLGASINTALASVLTSTQLIDDTILADEAAFTYATTKVQAIGVCAESTTDSSTDGTVVCPVATLDRKLRTVPSGYLSGGAVPKTMKSDNTDNDDKTEICSGPCTVYSITAFNHAATPAYLRCENDTSANTSPGSETAGDGEPDFEIPGNTAGAGFSVHFPVGISYATALTCWVATGEAASSSTDAATDDVTVLFSRVQ